MSRVVRIRSHSIGGDLARPLYALSMSNYTFNLGSVNRVVSYEGLHLALRIIPAGYRQVSNTHSNEGNEGPLVVNETNPGP
jgi:hypothetical protein